MLPKICRFFVAANGLFSNGLLSGLSLEAPISVWRACDAYPNHCHHVLPKNAASGPAVLVPDCSISAKGIENDMHDIDRDSFLLKRLKQI